MGRLAVRERQQAHVDDWALAMSPPGVLRVCKLGATLRYDEIRRISKRLLEERIDETLSEIVFDFANVHTIKAPWTPVVAQLIEFARRARASCRITALHGQPAAIVGLLLENRACRSLLSIADLPRATSRPHVDGS